MFYAKKYLLRENKKENIRGILSGINMVAEIRPLALKHWELDVNNFFNQLSTKKLTPVFISLANKTGSLDRSLTKIDGDWDTNLIFVYG